MANRRRLVVGVGPERATVTAIGFLPVGALPEIGGVVCGERG